MRRKPPLSESSLLAAIFSPKKNPVPSGLRKRKLAGLKGRKASRVKAFNNMSPLNQRLLDEAGKREAYLKGESTIADAKRALRQKAVDLGIAKPLRSGKPITGPVSGGTRGQVLSHLWQQLSSGSTRGKPKIGTIRRGTLMMSTKQLAAALGMNTQDIKAAAKDSSNKIETPSGEYWNPFWYN